MIQDLRSQLHFVRDVQSVDTTGVPPLCSIRDESAHGLAEATIGLAQLKDELAHEVVVGHNRRPRRRRQENVLDADPEADGWNVLSTAARTSHGYFVVDAPKGRREG